MRPRRDTICKQVIVQLTTGAAWFAGFSKTANGLHLGVSCLPALEILLPIFEY